MSFQHDELNRAIEEWLQLAAEHQRAGRFADAKRVYRMILDIEPSQCEAWYWYGQIQFQSGELDEAVDSFRQAIAWQSDNASLHLVLGNAHFSNQQLPDAIASFREAIRCDPTMHQAFGNLGATLQLIGENRAAVEACERAVQLRPDLAETHFNLALILHRQGFLELAIKAYERAVELRNDFVDGWLELGNAFGELGRMPSAANAFRRALDIQPRSATAWIGLGTALQSMGELEAAADALQHAAQIDPECGIASLTNVMQHLCRWDGIEELARRVIQQVVVRGDSSTDQPCNPFAFLALPIPTSPAEQLLSAKQYVRSMGLDCVPRVDSTKSTEASIDRRRHRPRLRIGYLSADFHSHATAWLIAELFIFHDRRRFEVFGYSMGIDDSSSIRQQIKDGLDVFRDLSKLSNSEATTRIAGDEIDILVDLKGYTQHARPRILAARPAPIQVNYLGYPGTMGAAFIDYILVDSFIVPPNQQPFFAERLMYLPGCYQVNLSNPILAARTPTRLECGLPEQGFVFCSFNDNYKLTPKIFSSWMRLLRNCPNSVLWLRAGNRWVIENLRSEAERLGVAAERIIFAPGISNPEHLVRHRLADLSLDSFPCNAHTTASDALRMGLPIVTLSGNTFVSRVAGSLLNDVGLPELITSSIEEYEAVARRLFENPDELSNLRTRLLKNIETCELYNSQLFARKIEKAFEEMWEQWQRN